MRTMEGIPNCSVVDRSTARISSDVRIGGVRIAVTQAILPDCGLLSHPSLLHPITPTGVLGTPSAQDGGTQLFLLVYAGGWGGRVVDSRRRCQHRGLLCWLFGSEVAVIPEIAVEVAGQLGGLGSEGGTSALEEDDSDDSPILGIGVGGEPAEAGAVVGACTRLAHD